MKVGIFCAGQAGDCATISSVLKYKRELWGEDAKIVWYISKENADLLKYQDIEVREFPRGFGYPEMVIEENKKLIEQGKEPVWEDWLPLVDWDNKMNMALKHEYPSLADIDIGYFPAPHQVKMQNRNGVNYPEVSKMVFRVPSNYEWHPVLKFSEQERIDAKEYFDNIWVGKYIFYETFAGSSQSSINEAMVERNMWICRQYWPKCNFIFGSHKFLRGQEDFPKDFFKREGVYSCADFTVRQTALISGSCDIFSSVSSGLTVATSCWGNNPVPILQFCGSEVCGTRALALGYFELISADYKKLETAIEEYQTKLIELLNLYK